METASETFAFTTVSFALEFLFLGRLLYLTSVCGKDVRISFTQCLSWPRRVVASLSRKESAQAQLILAEVLRLRVSMAKTCNSIFGVLLVFVVATIQFNMFHKIDRWMNSVTTWTNVGLLALFTFGLLCPGVIRPSTLNFWYVLLMLIGAALLSPWHTKPDEAYTFSFFLMVFFRIPCAILCTRISCAIALNFFFFVVMASRAFYEADEFNPLLKADVIVSTECLLFTLTLVCTCALKNALSRRAEMTIQRKNVNTQLSAAQSLLRLTCDAVVEVDNDLRLTKHSPELAAMLLKGGPCNLDGTKLTDLMPPMEAQRAEENLRRFSENDPEPAQAFHTRLVDSCSSKLCIEMFQVQYTKTDGQYCHLVGIRDFTDSPGLLVPASSEQSIGNDLFEDTLRRSTESSLDMDNDSISSTASGTEEATKAKKAFLDIDMTDMRVHAASAPVDSVVGMTVSELFPAPHTVHLLQRLQHEAIAVEDRGEPLRGNSFVYKELPVCFSPGKPTEITGSMQVLKTGEGPKHVLLSFDEPRVRSRSKSSIRSSQHGPSQKSQGTPAQAAVESLADKPALKDPRHASTQL
mmetsp:Transcript_64530/g.151189  ORF Transcript_64530/g.151189 Transcript_64530/m.151189 type:complete len:578 (+) Transcript_64530:22-1755(+)